MPLMNETEIERLRQENIKLRDMLAVTLEAYRRYILFDIETRDKRCCCGNGCK